MTTFTQGNVAAGGTDEGNPVKMGGVAGSAAPTPVSAGQRVNLWLGLSGNLALGGVATSGADAVGNNALAALPSLTNGAASLLWVAPSEFNGASWDRNVKSNLSHRLLSAAASTNATSVKASAGNVFKIFGVSANAAARYLKFYNKASAPTVGTDTPVLTFYIPPNTVNGGQFSFDLGKHYFSTGIAYAMTTAAADADTGALTAGDVVAFNITYS